MSKSIQSSSPASSFMILSITMFPIPCQALLALTKFQTHRSDQNFQNLPCSQVISSCLSLWVSPHNSGLRAHFLTPRPYLNQFCHYHCIIIILYFLHNPYYSLYFLVHLFDIDLVFLCIGCLSQQNEIFNRIEKLQSQVMAHNRCSIHIFKWIKVDKSERKI